MGTDARIGSTVGVRMRHVIDRGEGAQSTRHRVLALVSEGKSYQERGGVHSTVRGAEGSR